MREFIFGLIGGTALLMYGVDKMGEGLEKAAGRLMKTILMVLTGRVWSAFIVGILVTALVQSSTAITVLTVGFVNAGLMKLPQAVGIIYGANIGTTITAQMMAFSFHFKLTDIALPVLGIGFAITYFAKQDTLKNIGEALMGFGIMFLGLKILNSGIPFMRENETMRYFFLNYASIPIVGIALGALATALVHSSSATVGLVMVLGMAGLVDLTTAVCIMLGDNIGTCITAQLASLTGNTNARRTAWAHTLYNVFGVILAGVTLPWFVEIVRATTIYLQPNSDISAQIANSHTIFNVLSAVVFLPITKYYVRFLEFVIRGRKEKTGTMYLDKLLLDTPVAAIKASVSEILRASEITRGMVMNVMDCIMEGDEKKLELVKKDEEVMNKLQRDITSYTVALSKQRITAGQAEMIPALINSINHLERVGDHSQSLVDLCHIKIDRQLPFSEEAIGELKELVNIIEEMFDASVQTIIANDREQLKKLAAMEDQVDEMSAKLVQSHIERLEDGKCTVESGVIFIDIVNYLERIADHVYKYCRDASVDLQSKDEVKAPVQAM